MKRILGVLLLILGIAGSASAQETVNGTVTDRKGVPMPGVRVSSIDKRVTASAVTELDGTFWLQADRRPRKIVAEYVGFHERESRTKRNPLILKLKKESKLSYQGELSVGYIWANLNSVGLYESAHPGLRELFERAYIETVQGIRFNKYFFAGVGAQLQIPVYRSGYINEPGYLGFVDFKLYWPVTKKFMPYLSADLGLGYQEDMYCELSEYESAHDNISFEDFFYGAYSIGFNLGHLNIAVGVMQQTFKVNYYDWDISYYDAVDHGKRTLWSGYVKLGLKW